MIRPLLASLAVLAVACSQTPPDTREWRATDHDHTDNPNVAQTDMTDGGQTGVMGIDEVALAAWRSNCVPCHGVIGRGDGPKGIPVKARNLTDPAWQESATDEQIATSITQGKGQMPKFALPASTVQQLVKLVRLLNAKRVEAPPSADADAAAPDAAGKAGATDAAAPRATDAGKAPPPVADAGAKP